VNEYTASNGTRIKLDGAGEVVMWATDIYPDWRPVGTGPHANDDPGYAFNSLIGEALREFYRHKEDERLGRWRWPEDPEYVVYVREDYVQVLRESDGASGLLGSWTREDAKYVTSDGNLMGRAALAYFDAHPEPKPWHDAQPGEVWVFTTAEGEFPAIVERRQGANGPVLTFDSKTTEYFLDSPGITAGRRIYPEDDS
jgi:hypothetical protein